MGTGFLACTQTQTGKNACPTGLANNGDSLQPAQVLRSQLNHLMFEHPQGQFALYLYADFRDRGKGITPSQAKSIFFLSDGAVAPVLSVVQTLSGRLDQLQAAILRDFAQRMQEVF